MLRLTPAACLVLCVSLAACSATRPDTPTPVPPATVSYPDETGAATPAPVYEAPAPAYEAPAPTPAYEAPAPAYEVPAPAYEPAPTSRQVNGFRVQVYASASRASGDNTRSDAQAWWTAEQRRSGFEAPLDAYVVFLEGLYKVRMGAFTNREDAETALAIVRTRFRDAFLVPDLVTIDG